MKSASGRVKDIVHLEHLEALREEIDRARAKGIDPQQGSDLELRRRRATGSLGRTSSLVIGP